MTDVYVKNVTQHDRIHGADGHAPGDYSRRHHEAAILIPSGPPLGQWVFKLVTSELRGQGVSSGEAVAQPRGRYGAAIPTSTLDTTLGYSSNKPRRTYESNQPVRRRNPRTPHRPVGV